MCVCVCVRVRACVRVCVCVCVFSDHCPHSPQQPETVAMLSKHGQRYSCQLPSLAREDEAEEEDKLLAHKLPNVSALLQPLSERPCLIKVCQLWAQQWTHVPNAAVYLCTQTVGWWTYEYCHGKFVRQYHKEGNSTCRYL